MNNQPPLLHSQLQAKLQQADSLLFTRRLQEAIRTYQHIIDQDHPEREHSLFGLGSLAGLNGYPEAGTSQWYRQIKQQNKSRITAYDSLSVAFLIGRWYEQGQQYYRQMMRRYPCNLSLAVGAGHLYFNWGKPQSAKEEYLKITENSLNYKKAIRQLAILSFEGDQFQEVRKYINILNGQLQKDVVLKLIAAFLEDDRQKKISKIQTICHSHPDYARAHLFLGLLFLEEGKEASALQVFETCNRIHPSYALPSIVLSTYFASINQIDRALTQLLKNKKNSVKNDLMTDLLLSYFYLRAEKYQQARRSIQTVFSQLENRELSMVQSTVIYIRMKVQRVEQFIDNLDNRSLDEISQWKEIKQFQKFVQIICSPKEQHINARIALARRSELLIFEFVENTFFRTFSFDHELLKSLNSMDLDEGLCSQLLTISISLFLKQQIGRSQRPGIGAVERQMHYILSTFSCGERILESVEEDQEIIQANRKIYTIKYTDREYNALAGKQYFSSYQHLFTSIKKIKRQMKATEMSMNRMITAILNQFKPEDAQISHRLDQLNLQICIDQLMVEALPELAKAKDAFYSQIQAELSVCQNVSLQGLSSTLKKKVVSEIEKALSDRMSRKEPLRLCVDNWIETFFFFSNQTSIVNAIKFIEQQCINKGYQITKVEGTLLKNEEIPGISIKIRVNNHCCKITFYHQLQQTKILFKKYIETLRSFGLGCSILGLLEINKVQRYPIGQTIRDIVDCSRTDNSLSARMNGIAVSLNRFLTEIEVKQYQGSQSVLEMSTCSKELRRQNEKFKTQISRLDHSNHTFLTEANSTDRAHQHSFDESEISEGTLIKNVIFRESKEGKLRIRTLDNESLKDIESSKSMNTKFQEADVQDNISSYKDHKQTICKSVQIAVKGMKINEEEDDRNSKTTQGEFQVNILKENIRQLEETIKDFEEQRRITSELLEKQRQMRNEIQHQLRIRISQRDKVQEENLKFKSLNHDLALENFSLSAREEQLMKERVDLQEFTKVRESERRLFDRKGELEVQIRKFEANQTELRSKIEALEETSKATLSRSEKRIIDQIRGLKLTLAGKEDNNILLERITSIQNYIRIMQSKIYGQQMVLETIQEIQSQIQEKEIYSQMIRSQDLKEARPIVHEIGIETQESLSQPQLSDEEEESEDTEVADCQTCIQVRDQNWKLTKKIYYHSLIFIILLFEAITFTFSTFIFK